MSWRPLIGALAAHWRRHPGQAATLLIGLALATALWTGVQAINSEARASYDRAAAIVRQGDQAILVRDDGAPIALDTYVALRRAGWPVAPVREGTLRGNGQTVTLLGLDPLSAPVLPGGLGGGEGADGQDGLATFIGPPGQLLVAPDTAGPLADALSGRVDAPEIVETADVTPGTAIGDLATVTRLLGDTTVLSRLSLTAEPAATLPPLDQVAPGLSRQQEGQGVDPAGLTGAFHLNLTAFGILSFAVGLFIVHGAVGLAFEQRRGTIRTLRALGVSLRALAIALTVELAVIALIAGLAGVAMGYGIAALLLPDVAATLRGLYGAPASGALALRPGWIVAGLGMAALGTIIAGAQSLLRLRQIPILDAARPLAWRRAAQIAQRRQALIGAACLAGAGAALLIAPRPGADGALTAAFTALGLGLLGAALVLPVILSAGLSLGRRTATGPVAHWFWADSRQQLPGLSLALMALMLALAANIGVSTMVGSFRATFTDWLDNRLAADIFIDIGGLAETDALVTAIAERGGTALPRARTQAQVAGRDGAVVGVSTAPASRAAWPLLRGIADPWTALAEGDGAFVNEQLATRDAIGPGDSVTIAGATYTIAGIYADYGNPGGEAALALPAYVQAFPDDPPGALHVWLPDADPRDVRADLIDRFGLRPGQIAVQADVAAAAQGVFARTFAVTDALAALTLGVAAVAMVTSLATLSGQRLPQVAPLWALGLTRRRLAVLDLARAGLLAALTALVALPVGLALAWLLLARVNVAAFGWRLPLQVFPADWAMLAALAVLATLLAAAWPARRLATRPPADLLRVFASDR